MKNVGKLGKCRKKRKVFVKNLLQVSVLEALYVDESIRNELKKYMGFETEKIYNDVLKYFG